MHHAQPHHLHGALCLALALATGSACADTATGLGPSNFVDVGDGLADLIDSSGLSFSTLLVGAAALPAARPPGLTAALTARRPGKQRCPDGGSVQARLHDLDRSGGLSVGDEVDTIFKACVVEGRAVSGRSRYRFAGHRLEGTAEITELEIRVDQMGWTELRWTGQARLAIHSEGERGSGRYAVDYRDLDVRHGPHRMRWNFRLEVERDAFGSQTVRFEGSTLVDAVPLRLRQAEPFAIQRGGYPGAGRLVATDDQGGRLEVEAGRRRYAFGWFGAGNDGATPDVESQSRAYARR